MGGLDDEAIDALNAKSGHSMSGSATPLPAESQAQSTTVSRKGSPPPTTASHVASKAEETSRAASSQPPPVEDAMDQDEAADEASESEKGEAKEKNSYGTRSRNRRSNARPNYAEDVEMDFEKPPVRGRDVSSDLSNRSSPAQPLTDKLFAAGKKPSVTTNGWNAANTNTAIPGTSTFSANPNGTVPRKRKAQAPPVSTTATPPAPAAQTTTRRSGTAVAPTAQVRTNNMYSFDRSRATLKHGKLVADDGTSFAINDYVYLICEPPGDPYYVGRIMEFRFKKSDDPTTPVEGLRMNWAYRPRDTQRFSNDTRLVYATMHSDICPLTSLRGKCTVKHRSDIKDLEVFRKEPDSFWYNQCFDRFIHRWYEVIPVAQIINVPANVKKALDERWKYVIVEATRVKELTSAVKTCKRCSGYCATNDSVDCALCKNTYHLHCVRPPLLKKPTRGFAWACAPCSRAQERKLEARRTPIVGEDGDEEEVEIPEEEEEEVAADNTTGTSTPKEAEDRPPTDAEIAHAKMWPMRYLGIHCRVEDALQYDDRAIYPRASSRLGIKHQAPMTDWPGRPIELVKPKEIKKKYIKAPGNKKDTKLTKDTLAAIEADKVERANRPKWVQDEPVGYQHRGEDLPNKDPLNTAKLLFTLPPQGEHSDRGLDDAAVAPEQLLDEYMIRTKRVAKDLGVREWSTDFLDRAVYLFHENNFDADAAIKQLKSTTVVGSWPRSRLDIRKDLRDPRFTLTKEEAKRFGEGVSKFGSELRLVRLHVKTVPHADIVRFWYHWKKTEDGRRIWGAYGGRKNSRKKAETEATSKLVDDIADDHDDSAFDNGKVHARSRKMICKFCSGRRSRLWQRAPGVAPGQTVAGDGRSKEKFDKLVLALCQRCARLWRRYAIQWEEPDETAIKAANNTGKGWKKRYDEELLREWDRAQLEPEPDYDFDSSPPPVNGLEPAKKKQRTGAEPNGVSAQESAAIRKRAAPAVPPPPPKDPTPPPPIIPNPPKMRSFPCAVCDTYEIPSTRLVMCRGCRLTVHQSCYGLKDARVSNDANKFWCDMCSNDSMQSGTAVPASLAAASGTLASYEYKCVVCPVDVSNVDLVEPPKVTHKKKTERDREKERMEKELATQMIDEYRRSQIEKGRPTVPREALKRTADNNWIHPVCAIFTPEIKFSNSKALEVAEGIPAISPARWDAVCKICKTSNGACVSCSMCPANFHPECAHRAGYILGFDVTPVKSSRRDSVSVVTLGPETGTVTAAIWCKEHESQIKTIVHTMQEQVGETNSTALELFVQNYKQADLSLTGTMRRAVVLDEFAKVTHAQSHMSNSNRRVSTGTGLSGRGGRNSIAGLITNDNDTLRSSPQQISPDRKCYHCKTEFSPRWWPYDKSEDGTSRGLPRLINGIKDEQERRSGSPMDVDRPMLNGIHDQSPSMRKPADNTDVTELECHKCHHRRLNNPESFFKKDSPAQGEVNGNAPPTFERQASSPRPQAPSLPYTPLPTTLPQPPQLPGWHPAPYPNGVVYAAQPPPPPSLSHHPPPYHGVPMPPQPPAPQPLPYGLPPAPHMQIPAPPAFGAPPPVHHVPASLNVHGPHIPGHGHHIPASHITLHSPTHPPHPSTLPPHHHPAPGREGPFSHHIPSFAHHHGSPIPPPMQGPPPPMAMAGGPSQRSPKTGPTLPIPQPSTPRETSHPPSAIAGQGRLVHGGASASPSLRNLIDD